MKFALKFSVTKDPQIISRSRRFTLKCFVFCCLLNTVVAILYPHSDSLVLYVISAVYFLICALILWWKIYIARPARSVDLFKQ